MSHSNRKDDSKNLITGEVNNGKIAGTNSGEYEPGSEAELVEDPEEPEDGGHDADQFL